MNISQALQKLKNDLISWCTLNFKSKADATDVAAMQAQLDTLEPHPEHTARSINGPIVMNVDNKGHVTNLQPLQYVSNVSAARVGGYHVATIETNGPQGIKYVYLYSPTISAMCQNDSIILTQNKQYGTMPPSNPVNGQLFFLKVEEE